jgi:hypothetical protein
MKVDENESSLSNSQMSYLDQYEDQQAQSSDGDAFNKTKP